MNQCQTSFYTSLYWIFSEDWTQNIFSCTKNIFSSRTPARTELAAGAGAGAGWRHPRSRWAARRARAGSPGWLWCHLKTPLPSLQVHSISVGALNHKTLTIYIFSSFCIHINSNPCLLGKITEKVTLLEGSFIKLAPFQLTRLSYDLWFKLKLMGIDFCLLAKKGKRLEGPFFFLFWLQGRGDLQSLSEHSERTENSRKYFWRCHKIFSRWCYLGKPGSRSRRIWPIGWW